jgi:hypothetical protein
MIKDLLSPQLFPNVTTVRFEYVPFNWPPRADVHLVHPLVRMYVARHCLQKQNAAFSLLSPLACTDVTLPAPSLPGRSFTIYLLLRLEAAATFNAASTRPLIPSQKLLLEALQVSRSPSVFLNKYPNAHAQLTAPFRSSSAVSARGHALQAAATARAKRPQVDHGAPAARPASLSAYLRVCIYVYICHALHSRGTTA